MSSSRRSPSLSTTTSTASLALILFGIALTQVVAGAFDGFVKGMAQGAGIMMIILGVIVLGSRFRRGSSARGWLPSRDGDR